MPPIAILALINAGLSLLEHLPGLITALKQSKELTAEEEAALDARIAALQTQEHWKIR